MVATRARSPRKLAATDTTAAVDTFMATFAHPHKDAVEALRRLMLSADKSIAEGIKWNAPSFRTTEYFATTHLRARQGIAVILHLGAKVREDAKMAIADPHALLHWLAKDRAMVAFADAAELQARAGALQAIVRQWIASV